MSREFASKFYKSKEWQECRNAYWAKCRGLCTKCLEQGVHNPAVIIHHKVHISPSNISDPSVTLNFNNLEALCRKCHGEAHAKQKRYEINRETGKVCRPKYQ